MGSGDFPGEPRVADPCRDSWEASVTTDTAGAGSMCTPGSPLCVLSAVTGLRLALALALVFPPFPFDPVPVAFAAVGRVSVGLGLERTERDWAETKVSLGDDDDDREASDGSDMIEI